MTTYDRYITVGNYRTENQILICQNGHTWISEGYSEYGVWYPNDYFCPQCNDECLDYQQIINHGLEKVHSLAMKKYYQPENE